MNCSKATSRDQVIALHALYAQWRRHSIEDSADPRSERLAWASAAIGRSISSFSSLSRDEARQLIDLLKGAMGQPVAEQPNPWRHVYTRDRAHAAGTAGRADGDSSFVQLANNDDFARIHQAVRRLGWTQERYVSWLSSKSSPLAGRTDIRTVSEANKIWWALKNMLIRSGGWQQSQSQKRIRQTSVASI